MAVLGTLITPYVQAAVAPGVTTTLVGVLVVEGDHLEPTIGQIWPR